MCSGTRGSGESGLGDEEFESSVQASPSKADDNVGLNCCMGG